MKFKVPRRVWAISSGQYALDSRIPHDGKYPFLMPFDGVEMEIPDYFTDTKGRRENDCSHSKLVFLGGVPPYLESRNRDFASHMTWTGPISSNYNAYGWHCEPGRTLMVTAYVNRTRQLRITNCGYTVSVVTFKEVRNSRYIYYYRKTVSRNYPYSNPQGRFDPDKLYPFMEELTPLLEEMVDEGLSVTAQGTSQESNSNYYDIESYTHPPDPGPQDFLLHEEESFSLMYDDGTGYWKGWFEQHAFVDALEHMPTLNDNSISNVAEIAKFIADLVIRRKISIPTRLQDAWLAYRYTYQTTRLDAEEAIKFMHRNADLGGLSREIKTYGQSTNVISFKNVGAVSMTCRCTLKVTPKEVSTLEKVWRALYTYGLQPNFYVVWDMIPYSFIVDWLIPVGDVLQTVDLEANYLGGSYALSNCVYSLTYEYTRPKGGSRIHCYSRWVKSPPSSLNNFYWFDKPQTSKRVKCYRILDTFSLFVR